MQWGALARASARQGGVCGCVRGGAPAATNTGAGAAPGAPCAAARVRWGSGTQWQSESVRSCCLRVRAGPSAPLGPFPTVPNPCLLDEHEFLRWGSIPHSWRASFSIRAHLDGSAPETSENSAKCCFGDSHRCRERAPVPFPPLLPSAGAAVQLPARAHRSGRRARFAHRSLALPHDFLTRRRGGLALGHGHIQFAEGAALSVSA